MKRPVRLRPKHPRRRCGVFGVAVLGFLFLPIITMIVYSFNSGRVLVVWGGFGTGNYGAALANPALIDSVTTSVKAAVGLSFLATILGTLLGIGMAQRRGIAPKVLLGLLLLVLVTPEIVDAVALLTPWSVYVFSVVRNGIRPEIAGMSTLLLLVTGGTLALVGVVLRRGGSSLFDLS